MFAILLLGVNLLASQSFAQESITLEDRLSEKKIEAEQAKEAAEQEEKNALANKLALEEAANKPFLIASQFTPFTVKDIRIEGLQRVSPASVFANLPFTVGVQMNEGMVRRAIKVLFKTGNFNDIRVSSEDDVIVFNLTERPAIAEIEIEGNKALKTEDLLDGLAGSGLSEGQVFKRETLEGIRLELQRQYASQGRYDAEIVPVLETLPQNRVKLKIDVYEGSSADIKHLNIVGNTKFATEDLIELFEMKDSRRVNWFSSKDKYSRERLRADIEKLESFYRNKGYLNFEVESTQVALGPHKDTVFVTINVNEGEVYRISDIKLSGDLILDENTIRRLILLKEGGIYSQSLITTTQEIITRMLGAEGYAYASVRHYPKANVEDKTVELTFFVDPGQRTYVRRINFNGNSSTIDEVLRREMRQMEAAPASAQKIELSKVRLERLGFFQSVESDMVKVPGEEDVVDVEYSVEEQPSGSVGASIGYSDGGGLVLSANLSQKNFLGTGNQVGFGVTKNDYQVRYNFNYTNPYYTIDGVSRGFGLFYKETDFDKLGVAEFSSNSYGATLNYGYPISEITRIGFGMGYSHIEIETGPYASQEVISTPEQDDDIDHFIYYDVNAGLPTRAGLQDISFLLNRNENPYENLGEGFIDRHGDTYDNFTLNLNWNQSKLNRGFMPTDGFSHAFNIELGLPGTDLEYFKSTYKGQYFINFAPEVAVRLHGRFGYGDGYGETEELPFFENFYAGGFGSIRGYERSSVGPKGTPAKGYLRGTGIDNNGNLRAAYYYDQVSNRFVTTPLTRQETIGGNVLVESGAEFIFPLWFIKERRSLRTVLFVDAGNVFDTSCGIDQETCYDIQFDQMRASYGFGLTWVSALGPLTFSLAKPFNHSAEDDTKFFQFSIGTGF